MFASLTGRFTASHPPDSNADGSRLEGRVAHSRVLPSPELADPPASQQCLTAPLGPTAIPPSGIAMGRSLSDSSQVAGPSGGAVRRGRQAPLATQLLP